MERFRGGLVFKAHRLVYDSTLGLRVILENMTGTSRERGADRHAKGAEREPERLEVGVQDRVWRGHGRLFQPRLIGREESSSLATYWSESTQSSR